MEILDDLGSNGDLDEFRVHTTRFDKFSKCAYKLFH
jgi:hypothetical protein